MTGERLAAADPNVLPGIIQVIPFTRAAIETNWPVTNVGENTGQMLNAYRTSSGAQNAEIGWDLAIAAGTWTVGLVHTTDTDLGIYTILIDGVAQGTIDGYANPRTLNNWSEVTGIVIPSTARRRVSLKMATKNALSANYYGQITLLSLVKTA